MYRTTMQPLFDIPKTAVKVDPTDLRPAQLIAPDSREGWQYEAHALISLGSIPPQLWILWKRDSPDEV